MRVLELAEAELGVGLGAVGGDHVGHRPVAVGEQDPLAEQARLEPGAGAGVGAPGQPQLGGRLAGQGDGDDVGDPAGFADGGDLGLHLGPVAAGAAAGQAGGQLGEPAARLGQGLVQAAGLLGVQVRRVGEHRAAGHAQRGDGGVDVASARDSGRGPPAGSRAAGIASRSG